MLYNKSNNIINETYSNRLKYLLDICHFLDSWLLLCYKLYNINLSYFILNLYKLCTMKYIKF